MKNSKSTYTSIPRPTIKIFTEKLANEDWEYVLIRNHETLERVDGFQSEDDALEAAELAKYKIEKRYPKRI
jgi:hypothetical protein